METQRLSNLVFLMSMSSLVLGCASDDGGSDDSANPATTSGPPGTSDETTVTPTSAGEVSSGGSEDTTSGDSGSTSGGPGSGSASDSTTAATTTGNSSATEGDGVCADYATVQELCGTISDYDEAFADCKEGLATRNAACAMAFEEVAVCIGALSCREFDDPDSCSDEFETLGNCAK